MDNLPTQHGEDDMSFVDLWRRAVFADATLNTTTKLVALAIAEHADYATGRNAWPSNAKLSEMCACSVRTVTTARRLLAATGWIVAEDGAGRNGTTCCHLLLNADQVEMIATPLATISTPLANDDMGGSQMTTGGVEMVATNPSLTSTKKPEEQEEVCGSSDAQLRADAHVREPDTPTTTTEPVNEDREGAETGDVVGPPTRAELRRVLYLALRDMEMLPPSVVESKSVQQAWDREHAGALAAAEATGMTGEALHLLVVSKAAHYRQTWKDWKRWASALSQDIRRASQEQQRTPEREQEQREEKGAYIKASEDRTLFFVWFREQLNREGDTRRILEWHRMEPEAKRALEDEYRARYEREEVRCG